jgi:hypothetical protein
MMTAPTLSARALKVEEADLGWLGSRMTPSRNSRGSSPVFFAASIASLLILLVEPLGRPRLRLTAA